VLTPVNGQVGGTRADARSVSTDDQRHVIHGSTIYDLPLGRGRQFFTNISRPLDYVVGNATNSYNITTLQGYKYYQLRTAYSTSFGDLCNNNAPRYIQLGIKLYS